MSWSKLVERIEKAAEDLAVLDIHTVVSSSAGDPPIVELSTRIDQITGDIDNRFTESTFKLDYGERVLAFHERQRAEGIAILQRNVEVIRSLLELAWDGSRGELGRDGGSAGGSSAGDSGQQASGGDA
ncbi:MAG: hypothetical protein H6712_28730 [Myxococcales bacterium]|nr:hypothetical protein [Myxococcales bacterium]MCB9717869.1 hypothetical protein [Myxococcales bacterium]